MRRAHYLKHNRTTMIPKHHLCIATVVRPSTDTFEASELQSAGLVELTWQNGRAFVGKPLTTESAELLWLLVQHCLEKDGTTWIWFLDPAQDWPALQLTGLVAAGQLERDWWVWGDGPVVSPGKLYGQKVRLVAVSNWLGQVAGELPAGEREMPPLEDQGAWTKDGYCNPAWFKVRDCVRLVEHILSFVYREDLGHLCSTVGGQALQSFRHLHLHHEILVDDNYEVLALERDTPLGFPVECPAVGAYSEPIHVADVNGLYPYVMGCYAFPRKRVFYSRYDDAEQLKQVADRQLLIARVSGSDAEQRYLVKRDRKCVYTSDLEADVLVGPDLDRALYRNVISKVHEVCAYEAALLFDTWSPWAWQLRMRYKQRADPIDYCIAKALTVALWGRFAAQVGRWEPFLHAAKEQEDYTKFFHHCEDGRLLQCRKVAGLVDALEEVREGSNTVPCIAAFVAAYARMTMNNLRAIAGENNVLYQCADALHLTGQGADRLIAAGLVDPNCMGKMKLAPPVTSAYYHAPNIYRHGKLWTWAGRKVDAVETSPGVWTWSGPPSLGETMLAPMTGKIPVVHHQVKLGDYVDPDD